MPRGGAGRGQGKPLTPQRFTALVAQLGRAVARMERAGEPPTAEMRIAAVNLHTLASRLVRLTRIDETND